LGEQLTAKNRRLALMDLMLLHPDYSAMDLAGAIGLSKSRTSAILNDPVFKLAFEFYRNQYTNKLQNAQMEVDLAVKRVTKEAVEIARDIAKDDKHPLVSRQDSIRDILSQGHAKAVEKSAHMEVNMSDQTLRELLELTKKAVAPPRKQVKTWEKPDEDSEIINVSAG
jgi:hypothetical protein